MPGDPMPGVPGARRQRNTRRHDEGGYGKAHSGRRPGTRNYDATQVVTPVVNGRQQPFWNGERRQLGGFPENFVQGFLAYYYVNNPGINPKGLTTGTNSAGKTTYQCIKCKSFLSRKKDATSTNWISIDHRVPIRQYVMENVNPRFETIDGHHWQYYLLDECKAAHLTYENLDPMCQSCNSSLGGNKDLDGSMVEHEKAHCPGRKCLNLRYKPYTHEK